MKRTIYAIYDQVSCSYGGVFDFANESDMKRSLQNMVEAKIIPDFVLRDSVVMQLADVDFSNSIPSVTALIPSVVLRMEEFIRE